MTGYATRDAEETAPSSTKPVRLLILLIAMAILLNYVDRGNIGIAAPIMKADLGLSATQFGIAVSAFFWAYAPIQIVIGWLCDRFSIYRIFIGTMTACALVTLLTGLAWGITSLIALRFMLGLAESFAFPASSKLISMHVPPTLRGMANAAITAAFCWGPALGTLVGGLIMAQFGWRAMFVAFGLITLLWIEPWRRVTRPLAKIERATSEAPLPVSQLIANRSLWAMSIGHFTTNYVFYFVMTWLPLYLVQERGYSIASMAGLVSALFIAQGASALLVGWASDRLTVKGVDETRVRRLILAAKDAGTVIAIIGVVSTTNSTALLVWLVLGGIFLGCEGGNVYALSQILAGPRGTGTWVGIQNAIANFAGVVGPIATGMLVDSAGGYLAAFLVNAGIAAFGALWWCFALPGRAKSTAP